MMESLNLNWNAFPKHLKLMSKELYEEEKYFDVTLVSDDQYQFKAHKIILSACSRVFRNIIDCNPTQSSLIYLRGVQSQELEPILQFMYLGEGKLSYGRMEEFLKVAKDLQVKEIDINAESEIEEVNADKKKETIGEVPEEEMTGDETQPKIHKFTWSGDYPGRDEMSQEISHEETTFVSENCDLKENELEDVSNVASDYFQTQLGTKLELKFPASKKQGIQKLQCSQCDYQTVMKENMKSHVQGQHEGIKYPCTECPFTAAQLTNLRKHMLAKHDVPRYKCDQCQYQALLPRLIERHMRVKHSNRTTGVYSCDNCDYKARASSTLWYHKNVTCKVVKNMNTTQQHPTV